MSQAENLLNTLSDEGIVTRTALGAAEPHIVIGKDRYVTVPAELKRIGVEGDHNIETVTFDCPRYWDEHDLMYMAICINYVCPNGYEDVYPVKNVRTDAADDSIIHFDWTISNNVTQVRGNITFIVCAKTTDNEGNPITHWHSERNKEMYISEGLETIEGVTELEPDVLTRIQETVRDGVVTFDVLRHIFTNGVITWDNPQAMTPSAIGNMKVRVAPGNLLIDGNVMTLAAHTRSYVSYDTERICVLLYRLDKFTGEVMVLSRDVIIQGDVILSKDDNVELPIRNEDYYDILVCKITIPANATEITGAMIADLREISEFRHSGINITDDGNGNVTIGGLVWPT